MWKKHYNNLKELVSLFLTIDISWIKFLQKQVVLDDGKITEYLGNYSYYKEKLKEQEDLLAIANEQNLDADKVESKSGSADEPALSASESTRGKSRRNRMLYGGKTISRGGI